MDLVYNIIRCMSYLFSQNFNNYNNDTIYYDKYLKYKQKYIDLKEYIGGSVPKIQDKMECYEKAYKQHAGECWNDAIQTIITFSKPFHKFQKISDPNKYNFNTLYSQSITTRSHLIPFNISDDKLIDFNTFLKTYINNLVKRFNNVKSANSKKIDVNESDKNSITCAMSGISISNINKQLLYEKKSRGNHGGSYVDSVLTLLSLSFLLLDGNQNLHMDFYNNEPDYLFNNTNILSEIDLTDVFAMYLTYSGHAFCVYDCDNDISYYYDDNNYKSIPFDWRKYFSKNINYNDGDISISMNKKEWNYIHLYVKRINISHLGYINKTKDKVIYFDKDINNYKLIPITEVYQYRDLNNKICLKIDDMDNKTSFINHYQNFIFDLYIDSYYNDSIRQNITDNILSIKTNYQLYFIYDIIKSGAFFGHSDIIDLLYDENIKRYLLSNPKTIADLSDSFKNYSDFVLFIENYNEFFNPIIVKNNINKDEWNVVTINKKKRVTKENVTKENVTKNEYHNTFFINAFLNYQIGIDLLNDIVTIDTYKIKYIFDDLFNVIDHIFDKINLSNYDYLANLIITLYKNKYFNINTITKKDEFDNTVNVLHYIIDDVCRAIDDENKMDYNKILLLEKLFLYFMENFDNIKNAKQIIELKDRYNRNFILFNIMTINSYLKFQSIINLLFSFNKLRKINIFSNLDIDSETFLYNIDLVSMGNIQYVVNLLYTNGDFYKKLLTRKNKENKTFYEKNRQVICPLLKEGKYDFLSNYNCNIKK